ncbi:MAG TPA: class I SAM-dependent methyltransferase [Dehalococcoidia bacterium]|nr:class I SAM-dependent methyltransferase [Dehalococcoidia bacterium]
MPDPYAAIAALYDLEHDAFTADLDFYRPLADRTGGPILEVGCGTGRVAVALAAAGHTVIGLDPSPAMLDRARRRGAGLPPGALTLLEGRLTDLPPAGPVRLAIVPLNTWSHLTEPGEPAAALERLVAWLAPGGTLAIDLATPDLGLIGQPDDQVRLVWTGTDPVTGETVLRLESRRTDEARQVQRVTVIYDRIGEDGVCRRVVSAFDQRYTFPGEITALVERSGLIVHNVFGGYDLAPPETGSERLIVLAGRPGGRGRKRHRDQGSG